MTEATGDEAPCARDTARRDGLAAGARIAELEADNAALRQALLVAERASRRHLCELEQEQANGAGAAEAEEIDVLCRADAELPAGRAALREREERLRLIRDDATHHAMSSIDLERHVTARNLGAARLLGWEEAEIVGQSADIIFTPEDHEGGAPEREATRRLAKGHPRNERWQQRKDGSRFWGSGMVMPLRDPAAEPGAPPLGLLNIMHDQTERQRAEEALREGEARWRGVFEQMQEGFARCEMIYSVKNGA